MSRPSTGERRSSLFDPFKKGRLSILGGSTAPEASVVVETPLDVAEPPALAYSRPLLAPSGSCKWDKGQLEEKKESPASGIAEARGGVESLPSHRASSLDRQSQVGSSDATQPHRTTRRTSNVSAEELAAIQKKLQSDAAQPRSSKREANPNRRSSATFVASPSFINDGEASSINEQIRKKKAAKAAKSKVSQEGWATGIFTRFEGWRLGRKLRKVDSSLSVNTADNAGKFVEHLERLKERRLSATGGAPSDIKDGVTRAWEAKKRDAAVRRRSVDGVNGHRVSVDEEGGALEKPQSPQPPEANAKGTVLPNSSVLPAPQPPVWKEAKSAVSGRTYYWRRHADGHTDVQWDRPTALPGTPAEEPFSA